VTGKNISANFIKPVNKKAVKKLETGPASDTIASSRTGFLKFLEFIITGLAHPKPNTSKHKKPRGSKCLRGFKDNLPCNRAVSSPNLYAAKPCENS